MSELLIHIGYHKTASSWLQQNLFRRESAGFGWLGKGGANPVRRLVNGDPLEFDADAVRCAIEPLLERKRDRGLLPVISMERLSGHPFSGGYDCKEIADRLAAVFSSARVLIVVREQRSMILSTYKQYVRAGGAATLEQFLDPPRSKSRRVPWFDLRYFEYDRLIRYYRLLFGARCVLCLPFEQFVTDAPAFVSVIAEFAGRPLSADVLAELPFDARTNRAPSAARIERQRRRNKLGVRSEVNPSPMLGERLFERIPPKLLGRILQPRDARELEQRLWDSVADVIGDRYAESNRRTSELIGIDLAARGWTVSASVGAENESVERR
jgi:hypothetical protein